MRSFHPFPARMAPELALKAFESLRPTSIILDPMAGSGTVLRQASYQAYHSIGFDVDPLAVLMSRVATSAYSNAESLTDYGEFLISVAMKTDGRSLRLPWIDSSKETKAFVKYWFADEQRRALRKLSYVIAAERCGKRARLAQLALSRLIVTKEMKASLARDTSHSRPHKVATENGFNVFDGFRKSLAQLAQLVEQNELKGTVTVHHGDARRMDKVADCYVDAIITSPPYLNAIDYLRGHRLSLVWLGHSLEELRKIRTQSIGSERGLSTADARVAEIAKATGELERHSNRDRAMITRYAHDLFDQLRESARVLKSGGKAVYVVGNSCLRGNFIYNSRAVIKAATVNGFRLLDDSERELPAGSRYLPMPSGDGALAKRMRTESVLTFVKAT
ncbi:MAG: hypothetical protein CVV05_08790 [Gammaproteobacteria bacterium HGW-Gammaproteobacteria-1]|nr:MAG: hypothetical protein CVV05_08790 [Gammaproteobacteria bacterium HGW-Gammaproteobacteria-1]